MDIFRGTFAGLQWKVLLPKRLICLFCNIFLLWIERCYFERSATASKLTWIKTLQEITTFTFMKDLRTIPLVYFLSSVPCCVQCWVCNNRFNIELFHLQKFCYLLHCPRFISIKCQLVAEQGFWERFGTWTSEDQLSRHKGPWLRQCTNNI